MASEQPSQIRMPTARLGPGGPLVSRIGLGLAALGRPAAALANPWASVVLSGAVTRRQLGANLAALTVGDLPGLSLAEPSAGYWAARAARPWQ